MAGAAARNIMTFPEKSPYRPETAAGIVAAHEEFVRKNPAPDWLMALRQAGLKKLATQGLPTPRLERWKYTNLIPALKERDKTVSGPVIISRDKSVQSLRDICAAGTPDWLQMLLLLSPPEEDRHEDMALWNVGNAFLADGVVVDIPAGKQVGNPVDITRTGAEGSLAADYMVIRLGKGAELTLIEREGGAGWSNVLTRIVLGPNAKLRHYRMQEGEAAVHTGNTHVQIGRDATYEAFTLTAGGQLSRCQVYAELQGINGTCRLHGINMLRGQQHGDTTLTVAHRAPYCLSDQMYRTVLDDQSHGVFQGKIHVFREAQKTDGYQLSNTLILSEGAEMDTKPELEIYADDVKCSHGATTGQLDEEVLFYMRSRGIDRELARQLLISSFLSEVVEKIADESVKAEVLQKVQAWLSS